MRGWVGGGEIALSVYVGLWVFKKCSLSINKFMFMYFHTFNFIGGLSYEYTKAVGVDILSRAHCTK